tara:strand:+ start:112 stop:447 length:336 start_codon:yes stop_codon:yes gene_type:complete
MEIIDWIKSSEIVEMLIHFLYFIVVIVLSGFGFCFIWVLIDIFKERNHRIYTKEDLVVFMKRHDKEAKYNFKTLNKEIKLLKENKCELEVNLEVYKVKTEIMTKQLAKYKK